MSKKTLTFTAVIEIESDNFDDFEDAVDYLLELFDLPVLTEDDLPNTYRDPNYTAVFTKVETTLVDSEADARKASTDHTYSNHKNDDWHFAGVGWV